MIRVRTAISDSTLSAKIRGKIPKEAVALPADIPKAYYPTLLLKHLPADTHSPYAFLGVITEHLLRQCIDLGNDCKCSVDMLTRVTLNIAAVTLPPNVLKAKTTLRYLDSIAVTAQKVLAILDSSGNTGNLLYEPAISLPGCDIEGHPDMLAPTCIMEVKTSGQIKQNWSQFLLQTFTYAALYPAANHIHVVLPLQEYVWSWDVREHFPKRDLFTKELLNYGKKDVKNDQDTDPMFQPMMFTQFPIGSHVTKQRSMRATIQGLPSSRRPYQIFFTNRAADFKVTPAEISAAASEISGSDAKLYVHTPYLLNLCMEPGTLESPNYVVASLRKHLKTGAEMGLKGVIVHTGKSVSTPVPEALSNIRTNILQSLSAASPSCPLLLETPAGQGTETLTTLSDFITFAEEISQAAANANMAHTFGVCVDTCHVFATGTMPLEYLQGILETPSHAALLKLIHFNDSKTARNSRVDRHAALGTGYIGMEHLFECATLATRLNIPMIVE